MYLGDYFARKRHRRRMLRHKNAPLPRGIYFCFPAPPRRSRCIGMVSVISQRASAFMALAVFIGVILDADSAKAAQALYCSMLRSRLVQPQALRKAGETQQAPVRSSRSIDAIGAYAGSISHIRALYNLSHTKRARSFF